MLGISGDHPSGAVVTTDEAVGAGAAIINLGTQGRARKASHASAGQTHWSAVVAFRPTIGFADRGFHARRYSFFSRIDASR